MGRVATLINERGHRVYGVAYEFRIEEIERLFEYLSFREKCGYSLNELVFRPIDTTNEPSQISCLCYYANEENTYFSKQSDLDALAKQIFESVGPSGTNKEYLYNLCNSLRAMGSSFVGEDVKSAILSYDEHLFKLEDKVKMLEVSK